MKTEMEKIWRKSLNPNPLVTSDFPTTHISEKSFKRLNFLLCSDFPLFGFPYNYVEQQITFIYLVFHREINFKFRCDFSMQIHFFFLQFIFMTEENFYNFIFCFKFHKTKLRLAEK